MIVLDASALIGFFDVHDAHHDSALQLLTAGTHERQAFAVSAVNATEFLVGAVRAGREAEARAALTGLAEVIPFGLAMAEDVARVRAKSGLKLPDACALATAVSHNAAVATFDVRLAREARRLGIDVLGVDVDP